MAKKIDWVLRAAVYSDLTRGLSADHIAVTRGVAPVSVKRWAGLAGMKFMPAVTGGGVKRLPMDVDPPDPAGRRYRRLTLADRSFIQAARACDPPLSMRQIARELGVNPSTVSREIDRHSIEHGLGRHLMGREVLYHADLAHYQALQARARSGPVKLERPELRAQVVTRLNDRYSPQQVAGELKRDFAGQPEMHVSHETIYQALYLQGRGALRHELTVEKALRSGRTGRVPRSKLPRRSSRPWLQGARLADRPAEVGDRAVPGHWEGDLVVGPDNSGIITLVERQARFTLLGRLPGHRDSVTVIDVLATMIGQLPTALAKSITWDQGSEMAEHARFTIASGCRVFFCDPHSPWQRATNENTNGLIRDFYPKGTNFNDVTDGELVETQRLLNIRPRRVLDYRKPSVNRPGSFGGCAGYATAGIGVAVLACR